MACYDIVPYFYPQFGYLPIHFNQLHSYDIYKIGFWKNAILLILFHYSPGVRVAYYQYLGFTYYGLFWLTSFLYTNSCFNCIGAQDYTIVWIHTYTHVTLMMLYLTLGYVTDSF